LTSRFIFHFFLDIFLDIYVPYLTSGYIIRSFLDTAVSLASISHPKDIFAPPFYLVIYDEFHVVASKGVFGWEPQLTTPHSAAGISGTTTSHSSCS
jgi:hypothetical protein